MLERIIRIVVSDQDNRCLTFCDLGRVLEMLERMAIFESRTATPASGSKHGLLWRPLPKAPPFGRGLIYFDRWWNPAVGNQATDRAFRIGQKRNVMVHKFTCRGTLEERIHEIIAGKTALAEDILGEGAERLLTEMNNSELLRFVALDIKAAAED